MPPDPPREPALRASKWPAATYSLNYCTQVSSLCTQVQTGLGKTLRWVFLFVLCLAIFVNILLLVSRKTCLQLVFHYHGAVNRTKKSCRRRKKSPAVRSNIFHKQHTSAVPTSATEYPHTSRIQGVHHSTWGRGPGMWLSGPALQPAANFRKRMKTHIFGGMLSGNYFWSVAVLNFTTSGNHTTYATVKKFFLLYPSLIRIMGKQERS